MIISSEDYFASINCIIAYEPAVQGNTRVLKFYLTLIILFYSFMGVQGPKADRHTILIFFPSLFLPSHIHK